MDLKNIIYSNEYLDSFKFDYSTVEFSELEKLGGILATGYANLCIYKVYFSFSDGNIFGLFLKKNLRLRLLNLFSTNIWVSLDRNGREIYFKKVFETYQKRHVAELVEKARSVESVYEKDCILKFTFEEFNEFVNNAGKAKQDYISKTIRRIKEKEE